jgi:hypothetical protein
MFHDDPCWGAEQAIILVGYENYKILKAMASQIKPFDRVVYEVTLIELKRELLRLS